MGTEPRRYGTVGHHSVAYGSKCGTGVWSGILQVVST